jgi:hypothetical protein
LTPAISEPFGQVAIYVFGSDGSPERPLSSDESGWLYVGLGSSAGARRSDRFAFDLPFAADRDTTGGGQH